MRQEFDLQQYNILVLGLMCKEGLKVWVNVERIFNVLIGLDISNQFLYLLNSLGTVMNTESGGFCTRPGVSDLATHSGGNIAL